MIRIVAAVLDTTKLTLYKQDGSTIVLPQGDLRIRRIIDEAAPQLTKTGFADVNMANDVNNHYADFEQKSSKVRLFRVAKAVLKELFKSKIKEEEETPLTNRVLGTIPMTTQQLVDHSISPSIIDEIMANAVKVSDPLFTEEGLDKQEPIKNMGTGKTPNAPTECNSSDTIIAVTSTGHVIPGMERIKTQFERAAKLGSPAGVERFLERIGSVIKSRQHSVEDLLKFLERGDLPIADDGCILIYKVLNQHKSTNYPQATYVDVHTSNVPQWIGAKVMMAPSLVDPNRRNECSNGLHVARRGYVGSFGGSVCVMAKLAPEDVIAVPEYDANKMRVCAYHIIFELSNQQFSLLKNNRPLTEDAEGKIMLAKALAGQHTRITHTVEITGQKGGGIKVTDITKASIPKADLIPKPEPKKEKLVPTEALPDQVAEAFDQPVDPKAVMREVETLTTKGKAENLVVQILRATTSYAKLELWHELVQLKKASKYGWDRLGVPADLVAQMTEQDGAKTPAPISQVDSIPEPVSVSTVTVTEAEAESYSQRINRLALITPMTEQTAASILQLKKQSKKGWAALKVSDLIAEQVVRLTTAK